MSWAVGFAVIKYKMGYMFVEGHGSEYLSVGRCYLLTSPSRTDTMAALAAYLSTRNSAVILALLGRMELGAVRGLSLVANFLVLTTSILTGLHTSKVRS